MSVFWPCVFVCVWGGEGACVHTIGWMCVRVPVRIAVCTDMHARVDAMCSSWPCTVCVCTHLQYLHHSSPLFTSLHLSSPLFTSLHLSSPLFTTLHHSSPLFTTLHLSYIHRLNASKLHSPLGGGHAGEDIQVGAWRSLLWGGGHPAPHGASQAPRMQWHQKPPWQPVRSKSTGGSQSEGEDSQLNTYFQASCQMVLCH